MAVQAITLCEFPGKKTTRKHCSQSSPPNTTSSLCTPISIPSQPGPHPCLSPKSTSPPRNRPSAHAPQLLSTPLHYHYTTTSTQPGPCTADNMKTLQPHHSTPAIPANQPSKPVRSSARQYPAPHCYHLLFSLQSSTIPSPCPFPYLCAWPWPWRSPFSMLAY